MYNISKACLQSQTSTGLLYHLKRCGKLLRLCYLLTVTSSLFPLQMALNYFLTIDLLQRGQFHSLLLLELTIMSLHPLIPIVSLKKFLPRCLAVILHIVILSLLQLFNLRELQWLQRYLCSLSGELKEPYPQFRPLHTRFAHFVTRVSLCFAHLH